jgi:amino acid transporter
LAKSPATFVREATGLTKQISGLQALGMALSGMGLLYVFNATVFTPAFYPDANPLVGPLIGLLLILPIAATYAFFSIALPRDGGDYVWTSRVLNPALGFMVNFAITLLALSVIGSVAPWISQWSLAPLFYDLGLLLHNSSFLSLSTSLDGSSATFWVAAIAILGCGAIVAGSTRLAGELVKYWTVLAVIIGVIFVGVVVSAGHSTFVSNFNTQYGANAYQTVVQAGENTTTGYGSYPGVPPIFSTATIAAGALGLLGYLGFYYPAYFAGEVKHNRTSQILAQVGGSVIFMVFVTIMFAVAYFGEGPAFVNAIAGLWVIGSSANPYLPGIPLSSGLSMFWTHNALLVSLFNLAFGGTIIVMFVSELFVLSRNIFAWSFDRVLPSSFASVNQRTKTPLNAIILMVVVALIYTYISIYNASDLSVLFSYGTAGTFICFIFVSLAAIIYPFRRKDLFTGSADQLVKRKIGGLPVLTILGALSLVISVYVTYAILAPAIGGPTFGSVLEQAILPTFVLGLVIYGIAYVLRRRQSIDLRNIAREIPPE